MATTLLGVEDSRTIRKAMEITFAGEDFTTILADSAQEAMAKLEADRPGVVVIDSALDTVDGYTLCEQMKARAPGVGVILLSSRHHPYDGTRGNRAGVDDYIDKPFDTQQLIDKVTALARRLAQAPAPAAQPPLQPAPVAAVPIVAPSPGPAPAPTAGRPRAPTLTYGSQPAMPDPGAPQPIAPVIPHAESPAAPPVAPPAAAAAAPRGSNGASFSEKLAGLGLSPEQVAGVLALSRDIVEKVVWEVVPDLAETMIREELKRLTSE